MSARLGAPIISTPTAKDMRPRLTSSTSAVDAPVSKANLLQRRAWLNAKGIDPTKQHQLDLLFPDTINQGQRFIPNDFARSAIFTAKNRNASRVLLKNAPLFHLSESIELEFTGEELRSEDDELVWMQLMHYAKSFPFGQPFHFSIRELVRDIGWPKSGTYYDKVRECLTRLKANELMIKNSKAFGISGAMSMIARYKSVNDSEGKSTDYEIEIDPAIIVLFAGNNFTNHNWETFRRLSPVARRLADYIESHKHPFPLDLDKFRQLCGTSSATNFGWRRTVHKSCREIEEQGIAKSCSLSFDNQIYIHR